MRLLIGFAAWWLCVLACKAVDTNQFLVCSHTNSAGQVLPYRLLLPQDYDPAQSYPVILYLHGAAARGNDNLEPLNWGPLLFLEPKLRAKNRFLLVVPQCPAGQGWVELDFKSNSLRESAALSHAIELVGSVLPGKYHVDSKRRYITGVSMGGGGTWVSVIRRPNFFAAAVPICAPGLPEMVNSKAARVPVWVFHSDDDHLVPVSQAREMVKAWKKNGGTPKYTEYTGLKHSSWKKAYTELAMFQWLLDQRTP